MKPKNILIFGCLALSNIGFSQLDEYESTQTSMISEPEQNGLMKYIQPNNFMPGHCFEHYKMEKNDIKNDMILLDVHIDSLAHYKHYKYQQAFNGVPVEGVGCFEHYDPNGNLIFSNHKHAIDLEVEVNPTYNQTQILDLFFDQLPPNQHFAWEHPHWEQQIRIDEADSNLTWYPIPELLIAIDTLKGMVTDIDGSRYRLAYKIKVKTISPAVESTIYYIDAHTGEIFRTEDGHIYNGPAGVYGYGSRIIDTRWSGGFTQKYILYTNDDTRNIHTKKNPSGSWLLASETKDSDDNWGNTYLTETSTHYHVSTCWDYYRNVFGRTGQNNESREIRVTTQLNEENAYFEPDGGSHNNLVFGKSGGWDYGMEPSIVAHEFTHGVTHHTSNLSYSDESGALNESFSDIFGVVIQAVMLDGGSTDWIMGNFIPNAPTRSLSNPNSMGLHWLGTYDQFGNPNMGTGQPDTYGGDYWCANCPNNVDLGGVHLNSGVQNHWFYILANGDNDVNDLGNYYDVNGIGLTKAARISYYALTSLLSSSSQYVDSRSATIQAAAILYGTCSIEHQNTIDAWYAVGIGNENDCTYTASVSELNNNDLLIYPNPASSSLNIELPAQLISTVKIYDVAGRLVIEQESNSLAFQIDVTSLEKGTYSILFEFAEGIINKRFIAQ
jgi:Zn-dependent metalloprotease